MKACVLVLLGAIALVALADLLPPPADPVSFRICESGDLVGTTCDNPGQCVNACARWCTASQQCAQCCLSFASSPMAMRSCNAYCSVIF
jgi:hypothetical protein